VMLYVIRVFYLFLPWHASPLSMIKAICFVLLCRVTRQPLRARPTR
jgi:hypothetical protein